MSNNINDLYENYDEENRLFRDKAHLPEYLTTTRYFDRLFSPNSKILDACAGTGRYSFYLADKGHNVTALDLVPHNIKIIKNKDKDKDKVNKLNDIQVCDVLDLSRFNDNSFDVVLCMGALYHLPTQQEKQKAISECTRVCKKEGLVVLAYLNRYAYVVSEIMPGLENINELLNYFDDENSIFQTSTPSEIIFYATNCGLKFEHNVGVDGLSFAFREKVNTASEYNFQKWMEFIYSTCEDQNAVAYSWHGLYFGRK